MILRPNDEPAEQHAVSAKLQCPGLLVSVRNATEARTALCAGADMIDVMEPTRGPLGRATPEVIAAIAKAVGGDRPVSVALGELVDLPMELYVPLFGGSQIRFAKVGLAGLGEDRGWWSKWQRAWSKLPEEVGRVGVVYVDWQAAGAPHPDVALNVFADHGCAAILFDTWTKDGRSLVDLAPRGQLADWTARARAAATVLVMAGSLTADQLACVRDCAPDYVAVRGAVCRNGRAGEVSEARVRRFAAAIKRVFAPINP